MLNLPPITIRAIVITSALVGLIAYDALKYRRQVVAFARFTNLWDAPLNVQADIAYRDVRASHE